MSTVAQNAKEKGNAAFKTEKFPEAVGHYTEAILADSSEPTYPLNRAAAYLKLGEATDAEQDCSTVLRLSPGHIKALYRRAQARTELGKLKEAKADLAEALRKEPGNNAVELELQRVDKLLSEQRKDKAVPIDISVVDMPSQPQRRRVPIEIVEDDTSSLRATQATDTLTPISSRPLRPGPKDALPTPLPSLAREPSRKPPSGSEPAFQEPPKVTPTSRGGLFRASGQRTLFRVPETSQATSKTSPSSKPPAVKQADDFQTSSVSLFDFTRTWELASPNERWDLLCQIPPQALSSFFKNSLEATMLVQILEVCSVAVKLTDDPAVKSRVRDYLFWFQRVPRFSTVALFLSKQEKELARALANSVGAIEWKI